MNQYPPDDASFEDYRIEKVAPGGCGGWEIRVDHGWSFFVPPDSTVEPIVGMTCRMYPESIGFEVRGLFLDGQKVFYRTEAEQKAKHRADCEERDRERRYDFEKNRADLDGRYAALPAMFKARLDRFRANNANFRWEFEFYELFCCEQAVAIAERFRQQGMGDGEDATRYGNELDCFKSLPWEEQKAIVPELADGHSGNTFGCAVALAYAYLVTPEAVPKIHGALSPLVGSGDYGDVPRSV